MKLSELINEIQEEFVLSDFELSEMMFTTVPWIRELKYGNKKLELQDLCRLVEVFDEGSQIAVKNVNEQAVIFLSLYCSRNGMKRCILNTYKSNYVDGDYIIDEGGTKWTS